MNVTAAVLLLACLGGLNIALASQDPAIHDTAGMSAGRTMRVDSRVPNALARQHTKDNWICTMHPEIHKHAPGKCPICKMDLVKEKAKES